MLTFADSHHSQAFAKFSELRRAYTGPDRKRFETAFRETFGNAFYLAWLDWQRRHMPAFMPVASKSSLR